MERKHFTTQRFILKNVLGLPVCDHCVCGMKMNNCAKGLLCFPFLQVIDKVLRGVRLQPPEECPPVIGNLMWVCWENAPDRPTFPEIVAKLQIIEHFTEQRYVL